MTKFITGAIRLPYSLADKISLHLSDAITAIRRIGYTAELDAYAARRLGIFNLLNFIGFLTGLLVILAALMGEGYLPWIAWMVAAAPMFISAGVLLANHFRYYNLAMTWYFICYPIITSLVYLGSIDVGIELFFVLYGVYAVFFLQDARLISISVGFTLICYLYVYVRREDYTFVLAEINYPFFVFNHLLSITLIFTGLFLIKKENRDFQAEILTSNEELSRYNLEVERQKEELAELNQLKSKMFSVISHDMRTPIYGLSNLFKSVQQYDLPAEDIKQLVPEVVKNLQYTTDLMENLLQWAKSQLRGESLQPRLIDLCRLTTTVSNGMKLQAERKQISVEIRLPEEALIYAEKEMIEAVLRNLLSNAIKFTPPGGRVMVAVRHNGEKVEVQVQDTGLGMTPEVRSRLFGSTYYSTKGTADEAGSGLGLMICREFVTRNGGEITVESEPGTGSLFSFVLPRA